MNAALRATTASLIATVLIVGCRTSVPSMMDRIPPVRPVPGSDPLPPTAPRPGATASGQRTDGRPGTDEEARRRAVIVGDIVDVKAFEPGEEVDAYVPRSAFRWLVTFEVRDVVEGTYESEHLRIVVASAMERFAFPFAELRTFRLILEPTTGREYELVEVDPPTLADDVRNGRAPRAEPPADAPADPVAEPATDGGSTSGPGPGGS